MSERPKDGADPDATVMMPAGGSDPDATVMMPAGGSDPDATVMMPAGGSDPDATIAVPASGTDPDATVAIPAREPDADATISAPREPGAEAIASLGGLNRLIEAANPILAVVPQIRQALRHADPEGLRASLREKIESFETDARGAGAESDAVRVADFALCALIDESAACTPWGGNWSSSGLLKARHGESEGAENFFERLSRLTAEPAANVELIEFLYICLALGFEGRYRTSDSGRQELAELRTRLREIIRQHRPSHDGELSADWRGIPTIRRRAPGVLALCAAASVGALILAAVFLVYSSSLGSLSDPVARELAQLKPESTVEKSAPVAAPSPALSRQLGPEIARGAVAVTDSAGKSIIVIRGDQLFASGSSRLEPAVEPEIVRVAEALEHVPGTILVTGHTDDVPIRTARFPSNWELSTERARSVVKLMSGKLADPARLRAEGLADSEPVVPNDSAANRARNRRVTIILRSSP